MKKRIFWLLILLAFSLYGQAYPGCVFLTIYPGAREVGLAGAFSSVADNAFATYYNPAGLAFQKSVDFVYHKVDPWLGPLTWGLGDMHYLYSAITFPILKKFNFGLFYDYLNTGETEVWDEKGRLIGKYTPYDYALGISIGYRILNNLAIGGNVKYIYSLLVPDWVWDYFPESGIEKGGTGKTLAFDFGILYKNKINDFLEINNALGLKNLGPKIGYIPNAEKDPLPYEIRIGNSLKFKFLSFLKLDENNWLIDWFKNKCYLLLAYDLREDLYFEGKPWHSLGWEFSFGPSFFNTGYFKDKDGFRIGTTWAIGFDFKFLRIEWGTDSNIYEFNPKRKIFDWDSYKENPRFTISLNLRTPFIK
jgi:hypothetical protein